MLANTLPWCVRWSISPLCFRYSGTRWAKPSTFLLRTRKNLGDGSRKATFYSYAIPLRIIKSHTSCTCALCKVTLHLLPQDLASISPPVNRDWPCDLLCPPEDSGSNLPERAVLSPGSKSLETFSCPRACHRPVNKLSWLDGGWETVWAEPSSPSWVPLGSVRPQLTQKLNACMSPAKTRRIMRFQPA